MTDRPLLILCIEDDEPLRTLLVADLRRLAGDQFTVEGYATGEDAMRRLQDSPAQDELVPLVIAADHLPDTEGIDLLLELHEQPLFRGTRKVLMAADPDMDEIGRAMGKRAIDGVLAKPWARDRLESTVNGLTTEFFIEHAPGEIERITEVVDVELLSDAYAAVEERVRSADQQIRQLQRSILVDRDVPDDVLEATLVQEFDRVLWNPARNQIPAGTVILRSGDHVDGIQLVVNGQVSLSRTVDGQEVGFHAEAGPIIGLLAIARGEPAFFNVTATTDTTVIPISLGLLEEALQQSPTLAVTFVTVLLRSMARRNLHGVDQRIQIVGLNRQLAADRDRLAEALVELGKAQGQLIESEKMATLGQLVAGIGHELNNPVAAIERAADFLRKDIDAVAASHGDAARITTMLESALAAEPLSTRDERRYRNELAADLGDDALARRLVRIGILTGDAYRRAVGGLPREEIGDVLAALEQYHQIGVSLRNLRSSSARIAELVQSLRSYARPGREMSAGIDLRQTLEDTLLLFGHDLKTIHVQREYAEIPAIDCFPGQINQVWTNLISNAIQAMGGSGTLIIRTRPFDTGYVRVQIIDSGPGIEPEHLERIFDMHFTTRKGRVEFGLGLGLRISLDIINRHGGDIDVVSRPGRTCFTVTLPIHPPREDDRTGATR